MTFLEHTLVSGYARLFFYIVPTLLLVGAYTAVAARWPALTAKGARSDSPGVEKTQRKIGLTADPNRLQPAVGSDYRGSPGRGGLERRMD
jgi:hypothetical protein